MNEQDKQDQGTKLYKTNNCVSVCWNKQFKNGIKSTIPFTLATKTKISRKNFRKGKCILKSIIAEKNGEIC